MSISISLLRWIFNVLQIAWNRFSSLAEAVPREFDGLTLKYTRNSSIRNKTMKWTASGERTNKVDNKLESSIKQTEKDAMKTKLSVWLTH